MNFLTQYNVYDLSLEYLIHLFYAEVKNSGKNGQVYLDNLKKLFSSYFIKNYSDYNDILNNKSVTRINQSMVNSLQQYILNHLSQEISIDDLAFQAGLSKFYFLKEFKKFTGITPYQFILKLKLDRSKELLRETDRSISEIAYVLSFSDQSHFTRTFTKTFGYSPKNYKKQFPSKINNILQEILSYLG